jgi:uncharacterized protein YbgA (DUF1722 family)
LRERATRGTNTNVLMHLQGYLKKQLSADEKQQLGAAIEQYRKGLLTLGVPVSLLREHFREHPDPYIARQVYLRAWPDALEPGAEP